MNRSILTIAGAALIAGVLQSIAFAGPFEYVYGGKGACKMPVTEKCCFSYDFIDVAWQYSDYSEDTLDGKKPIGFPFVNQLKGVNAGFSKSIGCNYYIAGAMFNTDGPYDETNRRINNFPPQRGEFYEYRLGLGYRMCIRDNVDFNFEAGGIYEDCVFPDKSSDSWGWYVAPGVRVCVADFAEAYGKAYYQSLEGLSVWRFDFGFLVPVTECLSFKLGGSYEDRFDKTSLLVGARFNY